MDRLLITDVNGFLGSSLAATLADRFEVLGFGDKSPADAEYRVVGTTVSDWSAAIRDTLPQWIIHGSGLSRSNWDLDESPSRDEQPTAIADLAQAAREHACHLVVLSSDAVFTGPRLFHAENSPLRENDARVGFVRDLENVAIERGALVVRTHAYGWDTVGTQDGFAQRVWTALNNGQQLRLNADRHASPIFVDDLAELLVRAYRRNLSGLYHVAGGERTSPCRFASELATACGLDTSAIVPLPQEVVSEGWTPREETSLDSRRARRTLEAAMPLLREGLTRFAGCQPSPSKRAPRRTHSAFRNAA